MKVVLDTSAWYAFLRKEDRAHKKTHSFLQQEKPELIIPFTVLEELAALLHHRKGKSYVVARVGPLTYLPYTRIYYITAPDNRAIWHLYETTQKYLDYVDCSVLWLAKRLKLPIFTVDKHFKKAKTEVVDL